MNLKHFSSQAGPVRQEGGSASGGKTFFFFIFSAVLILGLTVSFQGLLAAWTAPLADPTACATGNPGCDAPVNTGALMQLKSGPLWLNTGISPIGLIVEKGNVGIGTVAPSQALHVVGNIYATGNIACD